METEPLKYGPLNLRRRAGAVAPFEVGTFSPYQATTATDVGSVLEQVKPSYTQTETVVFSVAGTDPWLGAPVATLQTASGEPVCRRGGAPLNSDGYSFFVDLTPTPSYKDDGKATSRRFGGRVSLPVRHKVDLGLPALKGKYRLQVEIPDASGGVKTVTSDPFAVTD